MKLRDNWKLDKAVETLRNDILQGHFVPGQRLVEADLVEYLGVTRTCIRQALRQLERQDLVEIHQNKGASVRKISREEVQHAMEVLGVITNFIVEKVAARVGDRKCRARLVASLEEARRFRKDSVDLVKVEDYMLENARFWGLLAEIAGNPILADFRLRLQNMLFRLAIAGLTVSDDREKWLTRHEDIITALLDNRVNTAVTHARKSGSDVWNSILALPDRAFGKPSHGDTPV